MDKLELCGVEADALLSVLGGVLAECDNQVLQGVYDRLVEVSARGKVVTVSLEAEYYFEGEFLAEYLEQLDDYEDTPSQREWFVLDRLFGGQSVAHLKDTAKLVVTEK